jgi:hypothetical protein
MNNKKHEMSNQNITKSKRHKANNSETTRYRERYTNYINYKSVIIHNSTKELHFTSLPIFHFTSLVIKYTAIHKFL